MSLLKFLWSTTSFNGKSKNYYIISDFVCCYFSINEYINKYTYETYNMWTKTNYERCIMCFFNKNSKIYNSWLSSGHITSKTELLITCSCFPINCCGFNNLICCGYWSITNNRTYSKSKTNCHKLSIWYNKIDCL